MIRRTTTQKIQSAIKNNLLILQRAEVYNKTTRITEEIPIEKFLTDFDFFCESGIFSDAVGWHFERNFKTKEYEIECSRMDGGVNVIITAYFKRNAGVDDGDVNKQLLWVEEE